MKVLSWNIERGLSRAAGDRLGKILSKIREIDADVVFLAEAHIGKASQEVLDELHSYAGKDGCVIDVKYREQPQKPMDYERRRVEKYGSNEIYMTMVSAGFVSI